MNYVMHGVGKFDVSILTLAFDILRLTTAIIRCWRVPSCLAQLEHMMKGTVAQKLSYLQSYRQVNHILSSVHVMKCNYYPFVHMC